MIRRITSFAVLAAVAGVVVAVPVLAAPSATQATTVIVTVGKPSEFKFTLSKKIVPAGTVTFKLTNKGKIDHNFKIGAKVSKKLKPGQSTILVVTLKKAPAVAFLCTLPGHAPAGMKGAIKVT